MSHSKAKAIGELKALIQQKSQKELICCSDFALALPVGAITEISGYGKTEFVLKILAEHKEKKVAWIEENFSVFPFGFLQRDIDLGRVLFVEAESELDWACLQVLRAQTFGFVIVYAETIQLNQLRRLQLASEQSGSVLIWLTSSPQSLWPVSLQIRVSRSRGQLEAQILRQRF